MPIPEKKAEPEGPKHPDELLCADRGGLVFVPKLGFTASVAELDFVSQFPSIMARFNISPETVNCPCCPEAPRIPELGYRICEKRRGITSRVVERLIAKRTELKKLQKVSPPDAARMVLAVYQERLSRGDVDIRELIVSKRITREPRDYQKAGVTAIAAQQLSGSGVKLRPGQTVEYVITDTESVVPNDRGRAFALWEGWFGYDRKKYAAMLREALEPFVLCLPKTAEENLLNDWLSEEELKRFPLFAALALLPP